MPVLPHRVATSGRVAAAATAVVALVLVASLSSPGPAAGDDDVGRLASIAELAPDPGLDPRIMALEFSGSAWNRAVATLDRAMVDLAEAQRERRAAAELLDSIDRHLTMTVRFGCDQVEERFDQLEELQHRSRRA